MNKQPLASTHKMSNALNLHNSLDFLGQVLAACIRLRFGKNEDEVDHNNKSLEMAYYNDGSVLGTFINSAKPTFGNYRDVFK